MQKSSKIITIVTHFDDELGSGHVQRMASLMDYMHRHTNYTVYMVCEHRPAFLSNDLHHNIIDYIPENSSLIIRDMRDSCADEILQLQKYAPVLVLDDMGAGRQNADYAWNLLPDPAQGLYRKDLFLCGYNFTQGLSRIQITEKDIDFSVYISMNPSQKHIAYIQSILPDHAIIAFLSGSDSQLFSGYNFSPLQMSPLEAMLRSKNIITHFGITLFEAYFCGLKLFTLNPSDYHSRLCEMVSADMHITNLGTFDAPEKISALRTDSAPEKKHYPQVMDVYKTAQKQCENFVSALEAETCL